MKNSSRERRTVEDRRRFNYTAYAPERRSGTDRREIAADKFITSENKLSFSTNIPESKPEGKSNPYTG